jgi:hypothetical protein
LAEFENANGGLILKLYADLRCLEKKGSEIMCENCTQIDAKIAHYRRLAAGILDKGVLQDIDKLISDLEAQKRFLHS